jgi:hypothetical protein
MCIAQYFVIFLACFGMLSGCRINRGGAGPLAIEDDVVDASRRDAAEVQHAEPPSGTDSSTRSAVNDPPDSAQDAGAADSGSLDAGTASSATLDASTPPRAADGDACGKALHVDGCNPIANTGCATELGMQCDVDLLAAKLSGQCVFSAPPPDAGGCLNIPPTETCPPGYTCVDFSECKKLCACDSDCDAGDCCNERLGDHGYKTCGQC